MAIDAGNDRSTQSADGRDHATILAALPEYVMLHVLGQQEAPEWAELKRHLAWCDLCRDEATALQQLMETVYSGPLPDGSPPMPRPDLSFLQATPSGESRGTPQSGATTRPPHHPPLVSFQFTSALAAASAIRTMSRTEGSRLRYAYQAAGDETQPALTFEVFTPGDEPHLGIVRICVERADRSPFDQAGTCVTLHAAERVWTGHTDTNGVVVFEGVPIDDIEHWQIVATS